jgi:hypothetical protein
MGRFLLPAVECNLDPVNERPFIGVASEGRSESARLELWLTEVVSLNNPVSHDRLSQLSVSARTLTSNTDFCGASD